QPPEPRIRGVPARYRPHLLAQRADRWAVLAPSQVGELIFHLTIFRVGCPAITSGIFWDEDFLDEVVQLVQVNIGKDGRGYAALRGAGKRGVVHPVLQVSGL